MDGKLYMKEAGQKESQHNWTLVQEKTFKETIDRQENKQMDQNR